MYSFATGLGVMVLLVPIQWVITSRLKAIQSKLMKNKDKRIKLIDEVFSGIKVGWFQLLYFVVFP